MPGLMNGLDSGLVVAMRLVDVVPYGDVKEILVF